jgi:hypothetical protein
LAESLLETHVLITQAVNPSATLQVAWDYIKLTLTGGDYVNIAVTYSSPGSTYPPYYGTIFAKSTPTESYPTTTIKGFFYHEAFTRILQSITGTADPFYSDLFGRTDSEINTYASDGTASLGVVLGGKQLRGFTFTDIPCYVSLKDLFTSLRAVYNIGMGIESNKVRIEALSYFYGSFIIQDATPTQLTFGNCKNIEESVDADRIFNKINIGFEKFESTELAGGLWEFNTKITYGDFIKSIKNELNLVSPYRGDDSGISIARLKPKDTFPEEDVNTDESNFILSVVRAAGTIQAKTHEGYDSITGTVSNLDVYNVDYSPARSIRRHGWVLRGFLNLYQYTFLMYDKQEKNSRLVSQETGGIEITESANIMVSGLDAPIWETSKYTFETPITQTQIDVIDLGTTGGVSNKYGVVKFRENDNDTWKYGWILSMKVKDDGIRSTVKFELLKVDPDVALTLEPS